MCEHWRPKYDLSSIDTEINNKNLDEGLSADLLPQDNCIGPSY